MVDGSPPVGYDAVAPNAMARPSSPEESGGTAGWTYCSPATSAGVLDPSFGSDGRTFSDFGTDEYVITVVVPPNGMIVVGGIQTENYNMGTTRAWFARYKTDGALDTSFGTGGHVIVFPRHWSFRGTSVYVQTDGRLLVAGTVRLRSP